MEGDRQPSPVRARFLENLGFEPDPFQLESFDLLDGGQHVIVAAPTGAGKTLVANYAVELALGAGQRLFYTTPIKALSNQKFHDLVDEYGWDQVGLLTGDNVVNPGASVVVMTTEVLRNMLYAGNPLDRLAAVVLDEVHYLQDAYRGPVWEEVIIHLPRHIQLVCLSATVSNASELEEWIETVRGPTSLVVESKRPVELDNHYLIGERSSNHLHLIKTVKGTKANPNGYRFDIDPRQMQGRGRGRGHKGRGRPSRKWRTPDRASVVELLHNRNLLPTIHFIFSRAACDDAAAAVAGSGLVLTTQRERDEIRSIVADRIESLSDLDLDVLGYERFRAGLEAGVAPHHAGMVPPLKEAVEACFVRGLVKVVFATETLALGINMPARTVVLEKLTKFTGDHHEFLTPAQYTQLTGRAGRRGIDTEGKAIVLWSPFVRFQQVADLAMSRDFVLSSSFRPTYNMAANLVRRYDQERARQLLNLSFAQFRADAGVVRSEHRVERLIERQRQVTRRIEREFGPVDELRAALVTSPALDGNDKAQLRSEVSFAISQLSPGDIIDASGPGLSTPLVTVAVSFRSGDRIRAKLVDRDGGTFDVNPGDLDEVPVVVGRVELPEPYLPNSVSFLHQVGQDLARSRLLGPKRRRKLGPSGVVRSAADVPPGAQKALRRLDRVDQDLQKVKASAARRAESLAGQFDRVIELLEDRGHISFDVQHASADTTQRGGNGDVVDADAAWVLTSSGQRLARLYHECDLLVVEAMEDGLFDGLNSAEVAAMASSFVYEERGGGPSAEPWYPSAKLRRRFVRLQGLHLDLVTNEHDARLPITRAPHAGFMAVAHGWAAGGDLADVLAEEDITAGDFVRTAKQLIDLLRQLALLASVPATASATRAAAEGVFRDLVAASSIVETGSGGPD
ncbi:MAG: DEAD/DEAH box helicase [Actinomycetia bacterium]|nr:DEAD/DEAH box helicase [Actinomycetes bacterium]MCP5033456.1 DEAD/DEAH box helicase [Actinomycetes bacterium]